jgi:hypothetical protein
MVGDIGDRASSFDGGHKFGSMHLAEVEGKRVVWNFEFGCELSRGGAIMTVFEQEAKHSKPRFLRK